ncbi:hypothetical protein ABT294_02205 [Nonomuraea sp. NPDC000554]|uniref:hypothetical protein n=1 Tax=Nonomuraea sp. NPDC000554 TaxID=3154259 RepID=UPI0033286FD5
MTTIRKSLAVLTAVGAASLGLLATAPAQANADAATASGRVPSCVRVWQATGTIKKTGYAYNGCGRQMNMKIVWAHGADGPCDTVYPGATLRHRVPRGIRTFDGAKTC